jgi:DNA-binding PadR family transcriptional regulator
LRPNPDIFVNDQLALEICLAARRASVPVSAYKLGQETDNPQSSLDRVLRKLISAGALQASTKTRGRRRVKVFSFDERWAEAVGAFLRRRSVGLLKSEGRVILLRSTSVEAAARLLRDERYCRHVAWVAEFDDSVFGAAIGLREDVERSVVAALLPELRRLGAGVDGAFSLSVGRTFDQPEAEDWTREILEGPASPLLPSGP